jgi:predicted metal-dependent hydrolase
MLTSITNGTAGNGAIPHTSAAGAAGASERHGSGLRVPPPPGVEIHPRRMHFEFEDTPKYWFDGEPYLTRFVEGLSMLFPEGERFFVEAVHHFKSAVSDPELLGQMQAFAAQEGTHGAEHHKYNVRVAGGRRAKAYEHVAGMLREDPTLTPIDRLAATVALEHFTAMLADEFLKNPIYASRMHPKHAELWLWHAVEETEHKAVAFDVYTAAGGGYARRATMMCRMTFGLIVSAALLMGDLLWRDRRELQLRHAWTFVRWGFLSPGFFRNITPDWFDFFRPGFHPWQKDNSSLIAAWKASHPEPKKAGA